MAGVKDITPDLDRLEDHLDHLEEVLQPLIDNLEGVSSQLPLLDKAKLFSLTAYAIESLLFSSLKIEGQDAQNHAVFAELKRVQQYFGKIKAIEEPAQTEQRKMTVNQEGAARVLKADLSDNKTISSKLAEKVAAERAKALLKSVENRKRPGDESVKASGAEEQQSKKHKKQKKDKKRRR